jgi:integrase/recombinase XerD
MAQAKTLTAAELRRATDYIATRPHAARNRAMLLTTHLAGLRVGEVALLSWSDAVDSNGQVREEVRLNADQTKGRHPRTVYISPKLQKELRAYIAATPKREPTAALFYTQKHPRRGFT